MNLDKFAGEILDRCDVLAAFSESEKNITRRFLSSPMVEVHKKMKEWLEEIHFQTRVDNIGNIIGRYDHHPDSPTVIIGSHLDTVINAGKYDGILGCLLPITLIQILQEKKIPLKHNIEIIGFSDEEGARYKTNFLGSLARIGEFPLDYLELLDEDKITIQKAIQDYGLDPSKINHTASFQKEDFFLEIHTEQGFVLQDAGMPLGVVTDIVGQTHWMMEFLGKSNHAGTCLMQNRQDSLVCAAKAIQWITEQSLQTEGLVATCGEIKNEPNSINIISEKTKVSLDVRHRDDKIRENFLQQTELYLTDLAKENKVSFQKKLLGQRETVTCSQKIADLLAQSFQPAGLKPYFMTSGAGHDAMIMARKVPSAMLFLRSPNGVSHHPSELVQKEDVEKALFVLVDFFQNL